MVYIVAAGMVQRNSFMNCFLFCIHVKTSSSSSNSTRNFEINFATSVVSGVPPQISPSYEWRTGSTLSLRPGGLGVTGGGVPIAAAEGGGGVPTTIRAMTDGTTNGTISGGAIDGAIDSAIDGATGVRRIDGRIDAGCDNGGEVRCEEEKTSVGALTRAFTIVASDAAIDVSDEVEVVVGTW